MKAHTLVNRQEKNRHWSPMPRKAPRRRLSINTVAKKRQKISEHNVRSSAHHRAKQGDYIGAIALFTQLLHYKPNSAIDYNNRGLIYFYNGQKEKALADYNRALKINPQLDSAYNNRANYYASVGQLGEALCDYEKALDLNPANIRTWINQAITFRELGLYDLAIENLDLALILGCMEDHIYAERGRTYHLRGDWNCAIADYQRALKLLGSTGRSGRLRRKIQTWMNDLLSPLSA